MFYARLVKQTLAMSHHARKRMHASYSTRQMQGKSKISIRTVDTDVDVFAVSFFSRMNLEEMWIAFGTGKNFRFIAIHEIVSSLSPTTFSGLLAFHAFTGCDTVPSFSGRGKKTASETWKVFPEDTDAFFEMTNVQISERSILLLERFVMLMYDKTSECFGVNEARKKLFIHKSRSLVNIPPAKAILEQHIKRASLQAHCWSQALVKNPRLPSPSDWG